MADDSGSIFDVLWRSYRFKWTLLLLLLGGFLAARAALNHGLDVQGEIDRKSAEARAAWFSEMKVTPADPRVMLPEASLVADQAELAVYSRLSTLINPSKPSSKSALDALAKLERRRAELADFLERRSRSFEFSIDIPGTKISVPINALWLLEIWPFLIVFSTAFLVSLGLRQRACEVIQSHYISRSGSEKEPMLLAKSGFLLGDLRRIETVQGRYFRYRPNPLLVPERLATWGLWTLFVYACFRLFPRVTMPDPFKASSTLWGIHTALIASVVLAGVGLWRATVFYNAQLAKDLGSPLAHPGHALAGRIGAILLFRWLYAVTVAIALAAFFLPWDQPWKVIGLRFLWKQKALSYAGGLALFPMPPRIFHEYQFQIGIALLLIAVSITSRLTLRRIGWLTNASGALSLVVLGLVVNTLAYWLMLLYRAEREVVTGLMDMMLPDDLLGPRGMPMVLHEPGIGSVIFMWALLLLCAMELSFWVRGSRLTELATRATAV